jgi:adenylate kinase
MIAVNWFQTISRCPWSKSDWISWLASVGKARRSKELARRGEAITAVVAIDVPRRILIERLAGRRVCSTCGRVYNVVTDPPHRDGICDTCGGTLIQRADDTPEAVVKRLDLYDLETAPVVQHYADQGLLTRVNGDRPVVDVSRDIISAIDAAQNTAAGRR